MQKLINIILGGRLSIQAILVFIVFYFTISVYFFLRVNEYLDTGLINNNIFYNDIYFLGKSFLENEKKQLFKIDICILSNIDKILSKGLAANLFPVDFIEIRDKKGKLIDSIGQNLEDVYVKQIFSAENGSENGSEISRVIPESDGTIKIISVFPFNNEKQEGWIILGNIYSIDGIKEKVPESFNVGIYSDYKKIGSSYKGLDILPEDIKNGIEKNVFLYGGYNFNNTDWDIFVYPLFDGENKDKKSDFLLFISPPLHFDGKNLEYILKINFLIFILAGFIGSIFTFRIFFISIEKSYRRTENLIKKENSSIDDSDDMDPEHLSSYLEEMIEDINKKTGELKVSNEEILQNKHQLEIVNRKLKKAMEEIAGLDKMKSQFLSNMSHEFRTPVALIISLAELLNSDTSLKEEQKALASDIYNSCVRLKETVDNVLALPEVNDIREDKILPCKLKDLIEKVKKNFNSEIEKKQLIIKVIFSDNFPGILLCKIEELEHVINNLFSNAVKFTGKKGIITVKIELARNNPYCVKSEGRDNHDKFLNISITDTGIGIKPQDQNKIFQKDFWQADTSSTREYEGSGLGLIITKKLVEEMNGTIWFYSKEGEGSTFGFVIPVEIK